MAKLKTVLAPIAVLLVVLAGCRGMTERPAASAETTLTVMTYNVYVGGRTDALLATTDPSQIPVLVAEMHATVLASNFPGRAAAIAGIVKEAPPHLIGCRRSRCCACRIRPTRWSTRSRTRRPSRSTSSRCLQGALRAEGLNYQVAGQVENFDVEMPMATATGGLVDVRLTD